MTYAAPKHIIEKTQNIASSHANYYEWYILAGAKYNKTTIHNPHNIYHQHQFRQDILQQNCPCLVYLVHGNRNPAVICVIQYPTKHPALLFSGDDPPSPQVHHPHKVLLLYHRLQCKHCKMSSVDLYNSLLVYRLHSFFRYTLFNIICMISHVFLLNTSHDNNHSILHIY